MSENKKSTSKVEVIEVKLEKHPNADALSIVKIYDYCCVVRTEEWKDAKLGCWLPPDMVVDTSRPEFAFLGTHNRIKVRKFQGIVSYGLLIPAPPNSKVGDDVAEQLGVARWEPDVEVNLIGGEVAPAPQGFFPKYDVDAFLRFASKTFIHGEPVSITEKLNGSNSKFVFKDGSMHCGSRSEWKREFSNKPTTTLEELKNQFQGDEEKIQLAYLKIKNWKPKRNIFWEAYRTTPAIHNFCEANPGYTLYGECYGFVKHFLYGCNGQKKFAAFDILSPDGKWLDTKDFFATCEKYSIPHVPILHREIPFDFDQIVKMCEGNTLIEGACHIREGIVVSTIKERWDDKAGRVKMKIINPKYHNKD